MTRRSTILLLTAALASALCQAKADVDARVDYYESIKPLLAARCYKCHGAETQKAELRLDVEESARRGGDSRAPAIVPGASDRSEMVRRIGSHDRDEQMPPKGLRLTEVEVVRIRKWIDEGAKWPVRDEYWAFQPPADVRVPEGKAANPIDRFIDQRLASAGIEAQLAADPRTLLRRLYFDLVGIPPSPAEAEAFFSKASCDVMSAVDSLVDALLADARYGERWARHWLDLVRYGESDGYEDDKVRPLAWRYRDYVVRSLNSDKPYDRFVQEQLAGDELWPDNPDAWIATGFARLGSWDGMSKEPEKQRQDFLNDATDATGSVFLGMTLGCARCHDHKYDAITQRDYYAVQAFFASVKRETRKLEVAPVEPGWVTAAYRSGSAELAPLREERKGLLAAAREALEREAAPEVKVKDEAVRMRVETDHPGQLGKLDGAIKSLEVRVRFHEPQAEVVCRDGAPRKIKLLKGGELSRPGEEVAPDFPGAMIADGVTHPAEGGRRELARWLTSTENPLTARVIVNRVWQHHFGTGLVATPSDFGRNGKRPTHPELLDWLAREFMRNGWSLKKLHRLILTSDAYRRASWNNTTASSKDPENKLLWRFPRRRLDAEAIRDTLLVVSGTLNRAMGGPGVYAKLPVGINVELPNNDKELSWGMATESDNCRRSIYLFQRRALTYPLMEVFDAAPMNQSCAARTQTTVAPQALTLFNGEFTRECAGHFAKRVEAEAGTDTARQIAHAFELAFTRLPNEVERTASFNFLESQRGIRDGDADRALQDFCHTLLNANELIHPD
jgi:hypothetical protein